MSSFACCFVYLLQSNVLPSSWQCHVDFFVATIFTQNFALQSKFYELRAGQHRKVYSLHGTSLRLPQSLPSKHPTSGVDDQKLSILTQRRLNRLEMSVWMEQGRAIHSLFDAEGTNRQRGKRKHRLMRVHWKNSAMHLGCLSTTLECLCTQNPSRIHRVCSWTFYQACTFRRSVVDGRQWKTLQRQSRCASAKHLKGIDD